MAHLLEALLNKRLVAVVRLDHYDQAVAVAEALLEGGISVIELTLTGSGAIDAIARVRGALGAAVHIGVGTVLQAEDAQRAIAAGGKFVVTPVVRPTVVAECRAQGVPIICGALTPTEVLAAHELGADMIKIFPARAVGPQYVRDLLGPFPGLRFVPTGGIDTSNARSYLDAGAAAVGIGGNLVSARVVAAGDWAQISATARTYVEAIG